MHHMSLNQYIYLHLLLEQYIHLELSYNMHFDILGFRYIDIIQVLLMKDIYRRIQLLQFQIILEVNLKEHYLQ
jgi:hypothetical protein